MIKALVSCFLVTILSLSCKYAGPRAPLDRPNIVILLLDDSGYGDVSHNGNPTISTPNITRLAREGASFTQFYTASPACSAARYSLLTGRVPGRSGLPGWVTDPESERHIHPREITLAEGLKARGYKTGLFGKWHLGSPNASNKMTRDSLPLAHGFDEWVGTDVSHDHKQARLIKSDPQGSTPVSGYTELARNLPADTRTAESLTGRYTDAAVKFIRENKDQPFFAYLAYNQPHLGLYVNDRFKGTSRRGLLGDVMAEIDDSVGRVLTALEESGIAANTLVIFTSDNGPWIRFQDTASHPRYGEARMHIGYALPFRDGKGSTWEGGLRVPGIFYWPGTIEADTVEQSPVSTLDILPTVFKLSGAVLPPDRTIDGRDIRAYLAPKHFHAAVKPFSFIYASRDHTPAALRTGPWKLHIGINSQTGNNYGFTASRDTPLLFQVEQDPGERIDRAGEEPARVAVMRTALENYTAQIRAEGSYWDQ